MSESDRSIDEYHNKSVVIPKPEEPLDPAYIDM
jgi:hypothetical protein